MPITITLMTPDELIDLARDESAVVLALINGPLEPGETLDARLRKIAKHAKSLATAFQTVDAFIRSTLESSPQSETEAPPVAGVCREGDPNTN